jgi:hypothetical protein
LRFLRAQTPLEPGARRRFALPRGEQAGPSATEPRGERDGEEDRGGRASAIDGRPELQARRRARRDSAVQRTRRRARENRPTLPPPLQTRSERLRVSRASSTSS